MNFFPRDSQFGHQLKVFCPEGDNFANLYQRPGFLRMSYAAAKRK